MSVETLLWTHDATGLAERVRSGEIAAIDLVEASIARAERTGAINAIAERTYDQARQRARSVDRAAPLCGVPFAIKDLGVAQTGVVTHSGSRAPPFTPDFDSVLVERYSAAGLIPIVTSTSPEHGLRLMTESDRFGITRNPWNLDHTSGGSSGGAASLVAAGVAPVAHASDGGGSIRVPAACTGLVGLKPSRGRIPFSPAASDPWYGFVVDHALTRSVRDTALLLDLTHGPDMLAPYGARPAKGSFSAAAAREPGRLSLAVYRGSPLGLDVSAETFAALDSAVALAREGGHAVEEIDFPFSGRAFMADFCRCVASAICGAVRAESARVGRSNVRDLERSTRLIVRFGDVLSGGEIYAALDRLSEASRQLIAHTARFDAVLMPIIAQPPLRCGAMDSTGVDLVLETVIDRLRLTRLLTLQPVLDQLMDKSLAFTPWPAIQNVSGQPSIALPVHVTASGLPLGIQAVGRPGDEGNAVVVGSPDGKAVGVEPKTRTI